MTGSWIDDPAIQNGMRRMLQRRADLIGGGERVIGWKLGFGAPAWLEKFDLTGPLVGFLPGSRRYDSGAAVSVEGWVNSVAEPEIALYMGRNTDDPSRAADAVAGLGPAIELADVDPPPEDIAEVVAGNIFHRALILGEADDARARADISGLVAHIRCDGSELAPVTDLESLTGKLIPVLTHTARLLEAFGECFRAGEVVIMGSVIPPLAVRPGQEVGFRLDPLGEVTVRV